MVKYIYVWEDKFSTSQLEDLIWEEKSPNVQLSDSNLEVNSRSAVKKSTSEGFGWRKCYKVDIIICNDFIIVCMFNDWF